jgi:hypothetical protein
MLKAADAFAEAGYDVRVVSARFIDWARAADAIVTGHRHGWSSTVVDYSRTHATAMAIKTGVRQRLARGAVGAAGVMRARWWSASRAFSRIHDELVRETLRTPADLVYAGTSGALGAAWEAAGRLAVPYALDLEDLHAAERVGPDAPLHHALVRRIEQRTVPAAAFVTTSSAPIADAYEETMGRRPNVIHNVFPLPATPPEIVPSGGPLRLYWFGQTIGPDRALEDVIDALGLAGISAAIDLRGRPIAAYVEGLRARAATRAPRIGIEILPPVDPDAVVDTCRRYDIGISTEDPAVENRRRCLSNKFCVYLLAGLAVAATDTPGQRTVSSSVGPGAAWYSRGDVRPLAEALRHWDRDRSALAAARRASWHAAEERWHWEHPEERGTLLQLAAHAVA